MIPKSFSLAGQEFRVVWDTRYLERDCLMGSINYHTNTVTLTETVKDTVLPKDKVEQVFFHELVHGILYSMREEKLNNDEQFVDTFSTFLHQALKTFKV